MEWYQGLLIALLIGGIVLLAISYRIFTLAFSNGRKDFILRSKDLKGVDFKVFSALNAWLEEQQPLDWWVTNAKGIRLHALYLPSSRPDANLVVLVHGYSANAKTMAMFAKVYREQTDMAILMPDLRAHGQSEGRYLGFGWLEKDDLALWIEVAHQRMGYTPKTLLHGLSLGASTVLNTAAVVHPPSVVGVISDSAFSDLRAQFTRQLTSIFRLPTFPLIDLGNFWCKLRLGFDYREGSPITHSSKIAVPVLLIHGDIDRFVPTEMSEALYAILTCPKKLVHYPDAAHALNYARHPQAYQNELHAFLRTLPL
jgi:uncharacterized protein